MRYVWTWLGVLGCGVAPSNPCQEWATDDESMGPLIELSRPSGPNIDLQAVFPTRGRTHKGAPTAVFVHGGWSPVQAPLSSDSVFLRRDLGFTTLYPNLGRTDIRGATSRSILARVLEYANGSLTDTEGCTLGERNPEGRAPEIALAGFSNGGNLAWATAGDESLHIPRLDGIATFETPPSSQFVTVEPGTQRRTNPRFNVDACGFDDDQSFHCDIDYQPLIQGTSNECESTTRCLIIDIDESGQRSDDDFKLGAVVHPKTNEVVYSTEATRTAQQTGLLPTDAYNAAEAHSFWLHREATRAMPAAVDRFPHLVGIATGTEEDHVLDDLPRPIHVLAMVQAMQESGVHWTRLHPDPKLLDEIHPSYADWPEVLPNTPVSIEDEEWRMEPEDDATIRGTDYLSAAIIEILDRSRTDNWSDDH